jgi:metal-responsive CopG/Arc/MetJ family transcriptional regulator
MLLADPLSIRLTAAHLAFLDQIRERHSLVTRSAAIRSLIEQARLQEEGSKPQQHATTPAS